MTHEEETIELVEVLATFSASDASQASGAPVRLMADSCRSRIFVQTALLTAAVERAVTLITLLPQLDRLAFKRFTTTPRVHDIVNVRAFGSTLMAEHIGVGEDPVLFSIQLRIGKCTTLERPHHNGDRRPLAERAWTKLDGHCELRNEKGPNQVDSGLSRYYCEVGENIGEL
jgi:hypothetical protein